MDIRDILGIEQAPLVRKQAKEKEKKPEGIPRELYSLIGSGQSIAVSKPAYKPSLQQKAVRWELRPFPNSARNDGLMLKHWIKASEREDDYRFTQFNVKPDVIHYTDEEYNTLLVDSDWTHEETNYLFSLCRTFDLRFLIIADRYEWAFKDRTIEDIKDRYYSVTRKVLSSRNPMGDPNEKAAIAALSFDKNKEIQRKTHLAQLLSRTPEQLAEEQALFIEVKKLEEKERAFSKERDAIMKKLYKGIDPMEFRKRKRVEMVPSENELPQERLPPGVHVRSQKLAVFRSNLIVKINETLNNMGLLERPLMQTFPVIHRFDELRNNISSLLEYKKQADKLENEVKTLRVRKEMLDKAKGASSEEARKRIALSPVGVRDTKRMKS